MEFSLKTFLLFAIIGFVLPVQIEYDANNDIRLYYNKLGDKNVSLANTCSECKLIVAELKNLLNDSAKLDRAKLVLKEMCHLIGGSEEHECMDVVDRVYMVLRTLTPYVGSPEQFCKDLHLCNSPRMPLGSRAVLHVLRLAVRSSELNTGSDLLCDECVFAATEMNSLLRNADFQQRLKTQMKHICHMLSSMQQKCEQYVDEYFPAFIDYMESIFHNPQHFCSQLKVCSGNMESSRNDGIALKKSFSRKIYEKKMVYRKKFVTSLSQADSNERQRVRNAACVLCKFGCQSLAEKLKENKETISAKLSTYICTTLPPEMTFNCLDFSRIYATSMLEMTIDQYVSDDMCVQFGFCSNKTLQAIPTTNAPEYRAAVCDACHTTTRFISYEFRQQALQQQLIAAVKQDFCPFLPGDLVNQCLDTVDQYIPMIMQRIADYVSGQNFCKEIGLCREII